MLKVLNPYTSELIQEIPLAGKDGMEKVLETAYALFQDTSQWLPAHIRIAILDAIWGQGPIKYRNGRNPLQHPRNDKGKTDGHKE